MRIHTELTEAQMRECLPTGVTFHRFNTHGSKSHDRAFDVILEGTSSHAAGFGRSGEYKPATWDEWGIFLNNVFEGDPDAKTPYYKNEGDFRWQTGYRFDDLKIEDQHKRHKWEYTGNLRQHDCACGASRRWL